ncbi:hypothetical protein RFI_03596 [Reticulomyxa filosa]|uniref:Uncharacterized protein n=1 Tax=Reticulomyxa filosa TaxID=46433 RepID=X6P5V8_RETFI|nr:hypothetical protein RFI_03596 [Reticulomyxa filosa]|eukprot:ETO33508.1 hypothetical protein RFI_03596 [Reticulomyxa filosa]
MNKRNQRKKRKNNNNKNNDSIDSTNNNNSNGERVALQLSQSKGIDCMNIISMYDTCDLQTMDQVLHLLHRWTRYPSSCDHLVDIGLLSALLGYVAQLQVLETYHKSQLLWIVKIVRNALTRHDTWCCIEEMEPHWRAYYSHMKALMAMTTTTTTTTTTTMMATMMMTKKSMKADAKQDELVQEWLRLQHHLVSHCLEFAIKFEMVEDKHIAMLVHGVLVTVHETPRSKSRLAGSVNEEKKEMHKRKDYKGTAVEKHVKKIRVTLDCRHIVWEDIESMGHKAAVSSSSLKFQPKVGQMNIDDIVYVFRPSDMADTDHKAKHLSMQQSNWLRQYPQSLCDDIAKNKAIQHRLFIISLKPTTTFTLGSHSLPLLPPPSLPPSLPNNRLSPLSSLSHCLAQTHRS